MSLSVQTFKPEDLEWDNIAIFMPAREAALGPQG